MRCSRNLKIRLWVYGTLLAAACACVAYCVWMPGRSAGPERPVLAEASIQAAAKMRQDVEHLVAIGERNLDHPAALKKAAEHLSEGLAEASGRLVRRERVSTPQGDAWNLFVNLNENLPGELLVVGAHYDTAPGTPGANDNGTGVAALLELARRFRERPSAGPLRLILFTNEEPPHFWGETMGSWVHAKGCRARGEEIAAMISLESLGMYSNKEGSQSYPWPLSLFYPSKGNFVAFVTRLSDRALLTSSVRTFRDVGVFPSEGAVLPAGMPGVGWSDHWSFWQEGYPALMITDTAPFRDKHYHEPSDTVKHLDFEAMALVVDGVEEVVRRVR